MLYKDRIFIRKRISLYQKFFIFYDIFILFINVFFIKLILENWILYKNIIVLGLIVPTIILIGIIFLAAFLIIDFGTIILNRHYFFRTVLEIQPEGNRMKIQCYKKSYYITQEENIKIKNIFFYRMICLKLPDGKKFYIWRYRMDGSGELLLNMQYFKRLFPYYDERY